MNRFRRVSAEPLWKEEFSVHSADERYVTRRQFSKFLVLTSAAMFVGNLWILIKSILTRREVYPEALIGNLHELPVQGVKLFSYPTAEDHCIMIRVSPNHVVAYSQKCTHLSCAVYYSKEHNRLECPCHQGYFGMDGRVLQGPPPRPLPRIELAQRGGQLVAIRVITREEGR